MYKTTQRVFSNVWSFCTCFLYILPYFYILKRKQFESKEYIIRLTENRIDNLYKKLLRGLWYFKTFKKTSGSGLCIAFSLRDLLTENTNIYILFNMRIVYFEDCPSPGYCGGNCSTECPQNCQDGYCDSVQGTCLACKPGFIGPRCTGKLALYTRLFPQ